MNLRSFGRNGGPTTIIGPPTSETHVLPEFWRDAFLGEWRCTEVGTPATWIQIRPAAVIVLSPIFEADLPEEQYAFYHAMDHGGQVLQALLGDKGHPEYKRRLRRWAKRLVKDDVEKLIEQSRHQAVALGRSSAVEEKLGYFVRNVCVACWSSCSTPRA